MTGRLQILYRGLLVHFVSDEKFTGACRMVRRRQIRHVLLPCIGWLNW
jgi:hypothetical protein